MPRQYVVHGTSMIVEADTPEEAVDRAQEMSGWHWEAEQVSPSTDLDYLREDARLAIKEFEEGDRARGLRQSVQILKMAKQLYYDHPNLMSKRRRPDLSDEDAKALDEITREVASKVLDLPVEDIGWSLFRETEGS